MHKYFNTGEVGEAVEASVEALEFREAKEPIRTCLSTGSIAYVCPNCNCVNNEYHTAMQHNFCENCGQRLKK